MKGVSFKKKEKLSDRTGGVTIMQTATKKETVLGIRQMAMIGVMTAVTCIAAPFSIPIPVSPVPLSLTTFILYLSVYILGTRNAFISYVIYLLLGLVGLPVFSGFSGGFAPGNRNETFCTSRAEGLFFVPLPDKREELLCHHHLLSRFCCFCWGSC